MKRGLVASTQQVPSEPVPKGDGGIVEEYSRCRISWCQKVTVRVQRVPDERVPERDGDSQQGKKLRDGGTVTEEQKDKKQDGRTVEEHNQHQ